MTGQDPTRYATHTTSPSARPGRLVGIDAARGLALVGMFAAHLIDVEQPVDWTEPSSLWSIVAGRSSVLFAMLAGVSLALVTGRDRPVVGAALATARARIAVRGVLIALLGIGLMLLETPVAVILTTYGLLFLVLLPALSWPRKGLLVAAGVLTLLASPIAVASATGLAYTGPIRQQILLYYPLATFAAYLLVGLAVGRCDLTSSRVLRVFVVLGGAAAVVAYTVSVIVAPGADVYDDLGASRLRDYVFSAEPHSSTLVDMVGSAGVAIAAIGVTGLLAGLARLRVSALGLAPLRMLARIGAMPLTIYSVHLVILAVLYHSGFLWSLSGRGDVIVWACFVAGACLVATLWGGRAGPLERFVGSVAKRVAPGRESIPTQSAPSRAGSDTSSGEWRPPVGPPL